MNKNILTIAGSDSGGGAGIQADIKTITVHKNYAMSVITALTAQNTTGVHAIYNVSAEFVAEQLDSIFTDIFPDSVKIGMLPSAEITLTVAKKLEYYNAKNIVLDPVMISSSGKRLMDKNTVSELIENLLPLTTVITPNIPEAQVLANMEISSGQDMLCAAKKISMLCEHTSILLKGGHLDGAANDLLYSDNKATWFKHQRINNPNTHGTGCTLSSAIASNLADGHSLVKSVELAKEYLTGAIKQDFSLGKGSGPLNHSYII